MQKLVNIYSIIISIKHFIKNGGYTGGSGDSCDDYSDNGLCGKFQYRSSGSGPGYVYMAGGGYYQGNYSYNKDGVNRETNGLLTHVLCLGGAQNEGYHEYPTHASGSGGKAGSGGTISASKNAEVYAFNGNIYSDGTAYFDGLNQAIIYAQNKISVQKFKYKNGEVAGSGHITLIETEPQKAINESGYINKKYLDSINHPTFYLRKISNVNSLLDIDTNTLLTSVDMSKQGVGSGAGYIEISNGTYTVYNEDSNGNFTTIYTES